MSITESLGWAGTVLGLVRTVPQMTAVYREKNLNGLSVQSCLWLLISALWWDVYALGLLDLPLIVSSFGASIAPALTWYKLTGRGLASRRDQLLLVGGSLLSGVVLLNGAAAVGLLASVFTVLYAVPQLIRLLRTRDVSGVSLATWILTAMNTSIWAAYGILAGLLPTTLPALVLLPTALLVMFLHARKAVQGRHQHQEQLHSDKRFLRLSVRPMSATGEERLLLRRGAALITGWALIALSIVLLVRVRLGVAPYDVLNTALASQLGVAPGTASWIACGVLVLLAAVLGARPGIGTLAGAFVVGGLINAGLDRVPDIAALTARVPLFAGALVVMYLGICGIIVSKVGAGPTELVTIGLIRRGASVRTARWVVEAGCLAAGAVLGGSFGLGTVIIMVVSGPVLAFMLPRAQAALLYGKTPGRSAHVEQAVLPTLIQQA